LGEAESLANIAKYGHACSEKRGGGGGEDSLKKSTRTSPARTKNLNRD